MTHSHTQYHYQLDHDGTFDSFDIYNPHGEFVVSLYFWDSPETNERNQAESAARLICQQLNAWAIRDEGRSA